MNIKEIKKEIERKENELNELKTQIKDIKTFEAVVILSINTNIKEFEGIKNKIKSIIDKENIKKFEELGIKKLAYMIQKQDEAFYITFEFDGIMETVEELEQYFRINNNILKFITIKIED